MKRLVIIGNGFDLHHRMKTNYYDYRQFLLSNGYVDLVKCFERGEDALPEYLWNHLEECIGLLPYEDAYCYLIGYGDENWHDSAHHDFQYEISEMTKYWPDIRIKLADWIKNVQYTEKDDKIAYIIEGASSFLSFNYTNTLEVLYGIKKEKIVYIHGDASTDTDLVLGHRSDSWYPEWDQNNHDEGVRLLEAGEIMDVHLENTRKQIETIIEKHSVFFNNAVDFSEVFIIGLSYNKTDFLYLSKIAEKNKDATWYFNWYSNEDYRYIDKYAKSLGVTKYLKINIDNLNT